MRTIETTAVVTPDRTITVQLPADVPAGQCRVVVVVEPIPQSSPPPPVPGALPLGLTPIDLPVRDGGPWPEGFTVRREQIYGDDGR
jgi:hypothetical protein